MSACNIQRGDGDCGGALAIPIVAICVHEHVERSRACPRCLQSPIYCTHCLLAGCDYCPLDWKPDEAELPVE